MSFSINSRLNLKPLTRNKRGRLIVGARDDIEFGILGIDKNKLKDNVLSICRLTTRKKVNGLPNQRISDNVKKAILFLLQGNQPDLSEITTKDRSLIGKIIKQSHVSGLDIPKTIDNSTLKELQQRLTINLGEIVSKNDSEENKK